MSTLTDELLKILGGFVAFIGLMVLGAITNGFVLKSLWGWFFVPVFALPTLSIAQAIGVAYKDITRGTPEKPWSKAITTIFAIPLVFLMFGWVLHFFV